ncbi:hypothetical protein JD276_07930 [Leucobacter sp. CSA1]|uniref:Htaa domain-containing protein n=1 Tax=Leucobacter chromiisoli TaxID=2796471 RepID=A0A934Q8W0_9MICO|nr:hypothetical protein [Leucobacter chromiisoli]MBK0418962.1 hypothetical protein [Leucobacter chromiisoli]
MNENVQTSTRLEASRGIKRRSVVKAAAWAAPVIATAVAVPAMSASSQPVWEIDASGVSGSLNASASTNTVSGSASAYYGLDGSSSQSIIVPALTATYTRSGAWASSPAPVFSLLGASGSDGLNPGSIIVLNGLTWTVVSNDGIQVVMTSQPTTVPNTWELRSPNIRVSGQGDGSGERAYWGVELTGAPIGAVSGNFDATVPVLPA